MQSRAQPFDRRAGPLRLGSFVTMRGLLGSFLLATGALAAALVGTGTGVPGMRGLMAGAPAIAQVFDPFSLVAGVALGLVLSWVARQPWSEIPRMMLAAIAGWRRTFVLASVAAACTGVLLFY